MRDASLALVITLVCMVGICLLFAEAIVYTFA